MACSSSSSSAAAAALLFLAMLATAQVAVAAKQIETVNTNKNKGGRVSLQSCAPACDYRCSQTQYHKPCIKYCNLCCERCLCVPPGFYGNKQVCPCYNNMKNARGGNKCP